MTVPQPLRESVSLLNTGIWNHDRVFESGVRRERRRGNRSEETLPTGGTRGVQADEWTPGKAAIELMKVQPRQLLVADAE